MIVCVIQFRNVVLVLQKIKQVKTRVDLKGKIVGSINGKVSLWYLNPKYLDCNSTRQLLIQN